MYVYTILIYTCLFFVQGEWHNQFAMARHFLRRRMLLYVLQEELVTCFRRALVTRQQEELSHLTA